MTNLQVQYQKLMEERRSNLANEAIKSTEAETHAREASIKDFESSLKAAETELKQLKAPYEIQELLSSVNKNDAQSQLFLEQINQVLANIDNIKANTHLTSTQAKQEEIKLVNDVTNLVHRFTGLSPVGDMTDTISGWIGSIFKGIGSGAGRAIGGLIA